MKKIAIVLSGCGVYDGAEIHEVVLTMLAASKLGVLYQLFAPDIDQMHVINHLNGEVSNEKRNVLVESARIARGNIKPLSSYNQDLYDGIVFPGGFGVAKNLCTFAVDGIEMTVSEDVANVVQNTHKAGKPIGALCISPVVIAKLLPGTTVTIGLDKATADSIKILGGIHQSAENTEVVIDNTNKIVTTPCYMLDSSVYQVAQGIENLMTAMIELMKK